MNKAEIEKKVKTVLGNYIFNETQLTSKSSFTNDIGLDSLDFAELILTVEQVFNISISSNYENIDTIDELVNTIENIMNINLLKIKNNQS